MKKRLIALMLIACMAFAVSGCKKEKEEDTAVESTEAGPDTAIDGLPIVDKTVEKEGIEAFVKLGQYKGVEVENVIHTVTEEEIDSQIKSELSTMPIYDNDPNRIVEMGDVVNLDYSGSVDGEVFDGGTSYGYDLEIGSGNFIDGFEDQLVGMHVGESGDITVTFPEDYRATELAGAEAVFAITINGIATYVEEPTEDWLSMYSTSTTVEEYREEVRKNLEDSYTAEAENNLYNGAWAVVEESAEFIQYPSDWYELCYQEQKASYEYYATSYGMDYDSFLESMGMTEESVRAEAEYYLQSALIAKYVLDMEGITEEDEAYQTLAAEILLSNGFETKEDAIAAGVSEWNINYVLNYNFVMGYLMENATVVDVTE